MSSHSPTSLKDGRYLLVDAVGEGGMARVYRAYDARLGVWRAIKVLSPEMAAHQSIRVRFESEARTMALLEHPNVVRIYDVDRDGDLLFMVMELLKGGTLVDWLSDHGPMPPRMAVDALLQVCEGVAFAHANGVVHRDLKPHNVLLDATGVCKVTDFGIARALDGDQSMTRTGAIMGTHGYMAPEQKLDAKTVDERADVYALAASLYVLLSNQVPPDLFVAFQSPEMLEPVPEVLHEIVVRATEYLAEDRYQTVSELAAALREVKPALAAVPAGTARLARTPPPDPPVPDLQHTVAASVAGVMAAANPPRTRGGGRRWALGLALTSAVMAGAGLLLVLGVGGWLFLSRDQPSDPEVDSDVTAVVAQPAGPAPTVPSGNAVEPAPSTAAPVQPPPPARPIAAPAALPVPAPVTVPAPVPVSVPTPAPGTTEPAPVVVRVVSDPAPLPLREADPPAPPAPLEPVPDPSTPCLAAVPPESASIGTTVVFRARLCEEAMWRIYLYYRPAGGAWQEKPMGLALGAYRAVVDVDETYAGGLEYYLTYGEEGVGSASAPRRISVR